MDLILSNSFSIETFMAGPGGRMKPHVLFQLMQQAAEDSVSSLGFDDFEERGLFLVMSRASVVFSRLPLVKEKGSLITWPAGVQGLSNFRSFILKSETGEVLAEASTLVYIINRETMRPVPLSDLAEGDYDGKGDITIDRVPKRIREPFDKETWEKWHDCFAGYSSIDMNCHVNNTEYIRMITDALGYDILTEKELGRMDITYFQEIAPESVITLYKKEEGESTLIAGVGQENDCLHFISRFFLRIKENQQKSNFISLNKPDF